jgi:hypothetical protein
MEIRSYSALGSWIDTNTTDFRQNTSACPFIVTYLAGTFHLTPGASVRIDQGGVTGFFEALNTDPTNPLEDYIPFLGPPIVMPPGELIRASIGGTGDVQLRIYGYYVTTD